MLPCLPKSKNSQQLKACIWIRVLTQADLAVYVKNLLGQMVRGISVTDTSVNWL